MIYTSGSTGRPKGAANTHAGLHNRLLWMQDAYGLGGDDVVLQKTPFSFDVSVWEFFWPLIVGARLVMAQPGAHRDPARLLAAIHEHGVTTLHFVPSMLQAFIEHVALEQAARDRTPRAVSSGRRDACASLRRIICSGEALPAELRDQVARHLPQVQLENLYGPTEASIDVTRWACGGDRSREVPIGRPIWNTRAYVLDGCLEPVPSGVVGELYIAGVGLARGYLTAFGADGGAVCGRPAWRAAWVGGRADVPDRGPGAVAWRRGAGVSGAGRCAGEAARVPDRAWRDRGSAAAAGRACRRRLWWRGRMAARDRGWSAMWWRQLRRRAGLWPRLMLWGFVRRCRRCCRSTWCRRRWWCWIGCR